PLDDSEVGRADLRHVQASDMPKRRRAKRVIGRPFTFSFPVQVLTHRDPSLEEIHGVKQKANELTSLKSPQPSSPKPHEDHKTTVHGRDGHTDLKTSVKPTFVETTNAVKSHPTTAVKPSSPVGRTDGNVKTVEPSTAAVLQSDKLKASPVSVLIDNSTDILVEVVDDEEVYGPTKRPATVPGKAASDEPVSRAKFRLRNTVHNCVPLRAADMLGFGNLDLSHAVAMRIPIACMIISMLGVAVSVFHAFTNLSRPRRCRSFVENVAQVILWTLCALILFIIRQDWNSKWEFGTARSFLPLYPATWHCAELLCYVVVVAYLLECYFYEYTYYKIYFEESLGNYTVVDRPEYGNSIYTSTVEMTEDTAL
ncbi:hypothetical protein GCK32_012546, partial [Trichostrongylus colubriformis]